MCFVILVVCVIILLDVIIVLFTRSRITQAKHTQEMKLKHNNDVKRLCFSAVNAKQIADTNQKQDVGG
jgi:Na+-transporting NADH:ubiquinone oxidoreductase subunit NqrF